MKYLLISLTLLLTACQPVNNEPPISNIKPVNQYFWQGNKPYPFKTEGELACVDGMVYFYPKDNFDKGKEGYTLNGNHPDPLLSQIVNPNTDLTDALNFGKKICTEFNESLKRN